MTERMDNKKSLNKVMSAKEAVSRFVRDGDLIISGLQHAPVSLTHEIARQGITDLDFVMDSDSGSVLTPLLGNGLVKKVITGYVGGGSAGANYVWRRALEKGIPRKVDVEFYSNYGIQLRVLAGAMNIPFLPTRSMLGSDIVEYNKDIKIIDDPYGSGDPVALVPAIRPDVALIHVHRADKLGNLQFFGHHGSSDLNPRSAKYVIASCHELVSTEEIRRTPGLTLIPQYNVDAVVESPFGAHWLCTNYIHHIDFPFSVNALEAWRSEDGFKAWCNEYIFSVEDWNGYLRKVGYERLFKLSHLERRFQVYGEVR